MTKRHNVAVRVLEIISGSLRCDRHGHELAGESPAIALKRREYVGEGKGA